MNTAEEKPEGMSVFIYLIKCFDKYRIISVNHVRGDVQETYYMHVLTICYRRPKWQYQSMQGYTVRLPGGD